MREAPLPLNLEWNNKGEVNFLPPTSPLPLPNGGFQPEMRHVARGMLKLVTFQY